MFIETYLTISLTSLYIIYNHKYVAYHYDTIFIDFETDPSHNIFNKVEKGLIFKFLRKCYTCWIKIPQLRGFIQSFPMIFPIFFNCWQP